MSVQNPSFLETDMPVEDMFQLAIREGNYKKPIYQIHKWWARRLGTVFRSLLIASQLSPKTRVEDFWACFYKKIIFLT